MERRAPWLALLIACQQPIVHSSITESAPIPLPKNWVECRSDADCIAIEMDCCDHCNGGWVLAVNRAHEARARAAYHASCDSWERTNPDGTNTGCGSWCTELGCGAIGQRCAGGRCVWTWDARMDRRFLDQPNLILPNRIPHGPQCPR